jgi:hypothetical protein
MGNSVHCLSGQGDSLMGDVVNLRLARKARARADKAKAADANRALHGEGKAAKAARKAEAERATRLLDGHHRDRSGQEPD